VLTDLAGKLRAAVRDELFHDFSMRKDVADEKIAGLCTCHFFARRNNIYRFIPLVNPDRDGVKAFTFKEVGDEVHAHDLKRSRWYFAWDKGNSGRMGPDFVGLTLSASLHVTGYKSFHPWPIEVSFGKLMCPQSSWVSNHLKVMMYPYGFTLEFVVVGDVKTPLKEECSILIVPVGEAVPDYCIV
jgi:hypothetical protein